MHTLSVPFLLVLNKIDVLEKEIGKEATFLSEIASKKVQELSKKIQKDISRILEASDGEEPSIAGNSNSIDELQFDILPISAKKGIDVDNLLRALGNLVEACRFVVPDKVPPQVVYICLILRLRSVHVCTPTQHSV